LALDAVLFRNGVNLQESKQEKNIFILY